MVRKEEARKVADDAWGSRWLLVDHLDVMRWESREVVALHLRVDMRAPEMEGVVVLQVLAGPGPLASGVAGETLPLQVNLQIAVQGKKMHKWPNHV